MIMLSALLNTHIGQNPSSTFRPLATSLRSLCNKLEEVDDTIEEPSISAEDTVVPQIIVESQKMLRKLDRATHQQKTTSTRSENSQGEVVADFLNQIDEATAKLSEALEAVNKANVSVQTLSTDRSSQMPRTPSTMTSQSDDGNKTSTSASSWSFNSRPTSLSQRMSLSSQHAGACISDEEQHKELSHDKNQSLQTSSPGKNKPSSRSARKDSWAMSPAYFDPMSLDIDTASSLITSPEENCDEEGPPEDQIATEHNSQLSRSFSRRHPPTISRPTRSETTMHVATTPPTVNSPHETSNKSFDPSHYHAVSSNHPIHASPITSQSIQDQQKRSAPHSRPRPQNRPRQTATSRYRVVNPEPNSAISPDSPGGKNWEGGGKTSARQSRQEIATGSLHISDVKRDSPKSPASPSPHVRSPEFEFVGYDEFDKDTINLIVRLWNETLWDQAKTHLNRLQSRHNNAYSAQANRRMQHLLGVIHSLQGDWPQALKHLVAAFDRPIVDARQLDVGHCAAAYWMGDIYALLGRRVEALLAYSVAARSPLLGDARWLPLRECLRAEVEVCRSAAGLVDWQGFTQVEAAGEIDSILDSRIMTRDVAKTILETTPQPTGQDSNTTTLTIPPNQNRGATLLANGLTIKSNQTATIITINPTLNITTTALHPTHPWPLPFDPLISAHNILPSSAPIDLLQPTSPLSKPNTLPKKTRLTFTCQDITWLVQTLRKCLVKLGMQWTETLAGQIPRFAVRYEKEREKEGGGTANVYLFSIELYRLSFRPGYGVDICPEGVCGARIMGETTAGTLEGRGADLHKEENKRVRKLIKEYLEAAARRFEALQARGVALPVVSINGVTSLRGK